MRVPRSPASRLIVGGLALTIALAACGTPASAGIASQAPVAPANAAPTPGSPAAAAPAASVAAPTAAPQALATSLPGLPLLWEKGGPAQAKPSTYWPAIDPVTGDVWVASSFDNKYWILSPAGAYLESWGQAGTGPGQLALQTHDVHPDGEGAIAFAPDGSFYIVDSGNYRVEKFDVHRQFVKQWGSFGTGDDQFANPKGIATDGKTVYVADDPRGDIQAFDTSGKFLRSFPFPFVLFTLGSNGNLYEGGQVFDPYGKQISQVDVPADDIHGGGFAQVAVDRAGNVFAPIQERSGGVSPFELIKLAPGGAVLGRWAVGGETSALAPDGSAIYFAYTGPQGDWSFIRKYALPKP